MKIPSLCLSKNVKVKPSFVSKITYLSPSNSLNDYQKKFIEDFDDGITYDARYIGEGVTSRVYYSPSCKFAIKQNKENNYIPEKKYLELGSLSYENLMLHKINDKVKTTQRGVAYAETETGGKYLLSTFVSGHSADINTNPFKEKHLDRLLRNLNRLDKSNLIHSDLSRPNLLLNDNFDVNIIDYQYAQEFNISNNSNGFGIDNAAFPSFEVPNNALMFESAALAGYLRNMSNDKVKPFLKKYLENKSYYSEKKVNYLKKLNSDNPNCVANEVIEFENAKALAYKNPTNDVLNAEILKMNILNLNRRQYSCHDKNKIDPRNILRAIPLCIKAKDNAVALTKFSPQNDTGNLKYFEYMNKYGTFWQTKMQDWYPKTLKWIYLLSSRKVQDPAHVYFPELFDDFSGLDTLSVFDNMEISKNQEQSSNLIESLIIDYKTANKNGFNYDKYTKIQNTLDDFFKIRE